MAKDPGSAPDQSLYSDRPTDRRKADIYWAPRREGMATVARSSDTAAIVVKRHICRCPTCAPDLAGLHNQPVFEKTGGNTALVTETEVGGDWPDAPRDIKVLSIEIPCPGMFKKSGTDPGINIPVEFTEVASTRVVTLTLQYATRPWPWQKGFAELQKCYRFSTDNPHVQLQFFWANERAQVHDIGNKKFRVKMHMLIQPVSNFRGPESRVKAGDKIKIILAVLDKAYVAHDIACLNDAITIGQLSDFPDLQRFFGPPQWKFADLGVFLDKPNSMVVFRLTNKQRKEMRDWLSKPLAEEIPIGIANRETALVLGLLLLWYLDKEYGSDLAEFCAGPTKYIKKKDGERRQKKVLGAAKKLLMEDAAYEFRRKLVWDVMGEMTPSMRKVWIYGEREFVPMYMKAAAVVERLDQIVKVGQVVIETVRIAQFVETVLREDTLYSSNDRYFFISFQLDSETSFPNGRVTTNLIPLGFAAQIYSAGHAFNNQLIFWESGDAFYLQFLDVDRHAREYALARAGEDKKEDPKKFEECGICNKIEKIGPFGSTKVDAKCSKCEQMYHWDCMKPEFGDRDCPRCWQRDEVKRK